MRQSSPVAGPVQAANFAHVPAGSGELPVGEDGKRIPGQAARQQGGAMLPAGWSLAGKPGGSGKRTKEVGNRGLGLFSAESTDSRDGLLIRARWFYD